MNTVERLQKIQNDAASWEAFPDDWFDAIGCAISEIAEIKRLRAALTETARFLTLEQLQELSAESVRALADMGLLNQQSTNIDGA